MVHVGRIKPSKVLEKASFNIQCFQDRHFSGIMYFHSSLVFQNIFAVFKPQFRTKEFTNSLSMEETNRSILTVLWTDNRHRVYFAGCFQHQLTGNLLACLGGITRFGRTIVHLFTFHVIFLLFACRARLHTERSRSCNFLFFLICSPFSCFWLVGFAGSPTG